ncbi:hypothetical protein CbuK_0389 [Coxiella burnetii CbuK_Q154]|uniref:Uncharacterized protein n=1 Tax=Coxiella burnetii (strain Dugway 5J108-111) TaxID=434922 RepID=A9KD68_COXBN|nr:hypothetical protein CBUD_1897 [Coxiella burnetii Dugway 5J108-111]ABX79054.1 hypothetical protein COXBURSA331_A0293 [Coxiella burnetii RSA 331]ACJ19075.1 hypothetical protein CbuG_1808 [Coxiella burnetii CbuG_Q212]ACJ19679.1 hypothetical protein CbuK_0389 [Coxiella burnetii CbuK_Q154]EDR36270.1 hypothetical protein COXBURSA334_1879 [Coxiella burnetii Q321]
MFFLSQDPYFASLHTGYGPPLTAKAEARIIEPYDGQT